MHDPTSQLQPSVSQIVADALRLAADALARWLEVQVTADQISASSAELHSAQQSLAVADQVLCCCSMPVDILIGEVASLQHIPSMDGSAGRLLMVWTGDGAARLIDQALHHAGTSSDPSTWQNLHRSVIAETSNVVGCKFLNAIAEKVSQVSDTDVALIPCPPHLSQRDAGCVIDATAMEFASERSGEPQQQIWLATSRFRVAQQSIETQFAMVWTPSAWLRLCELVDGPVSDVGEL